MDERTRVCGDSIKSSWGASEIPASMLLLSEKLKQCANHLTEWSKQSFGCIQKQLEDKNKQLTQVEYTVALRADYEIVKALKGEINDLLDKENLMWQQRSKALYLKSGDSNTSFFHNRASHTFRRNRITSLTNSAWSWCKSQEEITDIAINYYSDLFTSNTPPISQLVLDTISPSITNEMNADLLRNFSREEVEAALKDIEPLSTPGPDGMPPIFFQSF